MSIFLLFNSINCLLAYTDCYVSEMKYVRGCCFLRSVVVSRNDSSSFVRDLQSRMKVYVQDAKI